MTETVLTPAMAADLPGDTGLDVVTGAFSYSGSAIARELVFIGVAQFPNLF